MPNKKICIQEIRSKSWVKITVSCHFGEKIVWIQYTSAPESNIFLHVFTMFLPQISQHFLHIFYHRYLNFPTLTYADTPSTFSKAPKKMSWLFRRFNSAAKQVYKPRRELAIDESMVRHKGNLFYYTPLPPSYIILCHVLMLNFYYFFWFFPQ